MLSFLSVTLICSILFSLCVLYLQSLSSYHKAFSLVNIFTQLSRSMRSKAVCAFRVSSSFYASLDHARLRTPFTLQKHNTWITIMELGNNDFLPCCFYQNQEHIHKREERAKEREQETHTHSASCNTLSLPCLASFQIISICERISPERHESKSFLCLRFIPTRSKEIILNLLAWLDKEKKRAASVAQPPRTYAKNHSASFSHFPPMLQPPHRRSGCVWTSQHPLLPIWPRQGVFSAFLCTLIRLQAQDWKGWS